MNFETPMKFGLFSQHDEFSKFFEQQNLHDLFGDKEDHFEKSN